MDVVEAARRLADDTLFPAALATDAAGTVPVELLDALAAAGLYGLAGPASAGGLEADFPTVCRVIELLASGCLTTTFVWTQHHSVVMAVGSTENEDLRGLLPELCSGSLRGGLALGGVRSGTPTLRAERVDGGWSVTGTAPFVSGWGRIDVLQAAARTDQGRIVWGLVDARETTTTIVARRLELAALDATATVELAFREHIVPDASVLSVTPLDEGPTPPPVLRTHAAFPLGVARRCCSLLGPEGTAFAAEAEELRRDLDRLDPATIEEARGAAGVLAVRAAAALAVETGSRSLLRTEHAQRLVREALFCLVYALRPGSRRAALRRLTSS